MADDIAEAPGPWHRNQFIVAPVEVDAPEGWSRAACGRLTVAHHPAIDVVTTGSGDRAVAIVGFCFDALRQELTETDLAEELLAEPSAEARLRRAQTLSGRWALIDVDGTEGVALHDAGGIRQICHARSDAGVWLASHPSLLAGRLGLEPDPEAQAFFDSGGPMRGGWWPGSTTLYGGVRRLLPNHAVDLTTGTARRVWPVFDIERRSIDDAADRIATVLRNSVEVVARRAPLTLMLSGGWESRLVLAACRNVAEDMTFVSLHTHQQGPEDSTIAAQLASHLGLDLTFDTTETEPTPAFWADLTANVDDALVEYASTAEVLLKRTGRRRIVLTGHMPNIHTFFKKLPPSEARVFGPDTAVRLSKPADSPFLRSAMTEWCAGVPRGRGVPPIDLFRWEQQWGGSWLTPWLLQYDWSWKDCFLPLADYGVIEPALGVPARFRNKPSPELTFRIVDRLWPEVLEIEIDGGSQEREHAVKRNLAVVANRTKAELRYRLRQARN